MAASMRTSSSSRSGSNAQIILALSVRARARTDATIRRESKIRLGEGKKNLLALKTESSPMQRRSASSTGSTRMLRSSIVARASTTLVRGSTEITLLCMTSRTRGETSGMNLGDGIPKLRSTKSMRSLVSPHLAATTLAVPVRRLNSA